MIDHQALLGVIGDYKNALQMQIELQASRQKDVEALKAEITELKARLKAKGKE